jgi:hypothetical protein
MFCATCSHRLTRFRSSPHNWTAQGGSEVPVNDSMAVLSWLADAPMFIDSQQIDAFYDVVVGPAFRTVQLELSASHSEQLEKSSTASLSAGLSALFPWLKVDAGLDISRTRSKGRQEGQAIVLQPIESAARQLVKLSLHYLLSQQERVCVVSGGPEIPAREDISASPRMLAFVDVPPGTRFLPQAAELDGGRVVTFFGPLIENLQREDGTLPAAYPDSSATDEGKRQRDTHWKWYTDRWNADKAVKVMEEAVGEGGRPRWVDYRMIYATGEVLQLHVIAHGDYDTGVFAFNMIRRGERYGLRIVGSLKSKPALNVLAIYEK